MDANQRHFEAELESQMVEARNNEVIKFKPKNVKQIKA